MTRISTRRTLSMIILVAALSLGSVSTAQASPWMVPGIASSAATDSGWLEAAWNQIRGWLGVEQDRRAEAATPALSGLQAESQSGVNQGGNLAPAGPTIDPIGRSFD